MLHTHGRDCDGVLAVQIPVDKSDPLFRRACRDRKRESFRSFKRRFRIDMAISPASASSDVAQTKLMDKRYGGEVLNSRMECLKDEVDKARNDGDPGIRSAFTGARLPQQTEASMGDGLLKNEFETIYHRAQNNSLETATRRFSRSAVATNKPPQITSCTLSDETALLHEGFPGFESFVLPHTSSPAFKVVPIEKTDAFFAPSAVDGSCDSSTSNLFVVLDDIDVTDFAPERTRPRFRLLSEFYDTNHEAILR